MLAIIKNLRQLTRRFQLKQLQLAICLSVITGLLELGGVIALGMLLTQIQGLGTSESINEELNRNFNVVGAVLISTVVLRYALKIAVLKISHSWNLPLSSTAMRFMFSGKVPELLKTGKDKFVKNAIADIEIIVNSVLIPVLRIVTNFSTLLFLICWIGYTSLIIFGLLVVFAVLFYFVFTVLVKPHLDKSGQRRDFYQSKRFKNSGDTYLSARALIVDNKLDEIIHEGLEFTKSYTKSIVKAQSIALLPKYSLEVLTFSGLVFFGFISNSGLVMNINFIDIGTMGFAMLRILPAVQGLLGDKSMIESLNPVLQKYLQMKHVDDENEVNFIVHSSDSVQIIVENYKAKYLQSGYRRICASLHSGQINIVKGPSGSGKTSLLNGLAQLIDYDGVITYINIHKPSDFHETVAYAGQDSFVISKSLEDNVAFFKPVDHENLKYALDFANLKGKELDKLRLSLSKGSEFISGGQRQRLALARAIYKRPRVLLLDEVLVGLDEVNSRVILSRIQEYAKQNLVVMITHDLELFSNHENYIVIK